MIQLLCLTFVMAAVLLLTLYFHFILSPCSYAFIMMNCLPMFAIVSSCMFTDVYPLLVVFTYVYSRLFTKVYPCLLFSVPMLWN